MILLVDVMIDVDTQKKERQKIFGEILKRKIKEQGKSRKELAKALGITEISFGAYCTGKKFPSIDKLLKIAEMLKCSVSDLIADDNSPNIFNYRVKRACEILMAADFEIPEVLDFQQEKTITIKLKTKDIYKTDKGIKLDIPLERLEFENIQDFVKITEVIELKSIKENLSFRDTVQKLIASSEGMTA